MNQSIIKNQIVELTQLPFVNQLLKRAGISPPPTLRRSVSPWEESLLRGQEILVGGDGTVYRHIIPWLEESGASFLLSPDIEKEPFADIDHYRLPSLDQIKSDTQITGSIFDATALETVADLKKLYDFFHTALRWLPANSRVVVISQDPLDQLKPEIKAVVRSIEGFCRSLAKELGKKGGTVQLLTVGKGRLAFERLGPVVQFFLSDHAAFITGQKIRVTNQVRGDCHPPLSGSLAGKTALVTGAAQGIGLAISRSLAAEGAHVICLDRPESADALQSLSQEIEGFGIARTLGKQHASKEIVEDIKRETGSCDLVIHNAGITRDRTLKNMSIPEWEDVLNINLNAVMELDQALLDANILRDEGRVVCLSSIAGIAGNVGQTNYSTAKAGLIGYVEAQARELASRGITVNAIAPGFIETPMTAKIPFVMRQIARRMATLGQGGLPQDVADAVCFLSSPAAVGLSGQVLRVCGGHIMGV